MMHPLLRQRTLRNHHSRHNMPAHESAKGTEAVLPLYTVSRRELVLPAHSATPDKVRRFLVELLTTKRKLKPHHAESIAELWSIGSGNELRNYCASMYQRVFGYEDGSILFTDVQQLIWTHKREERKGSMRKSKWSQFRDRKGRLRAVLT